MYLFASVCLLSILTYPLSFSFHLHSRLATFSHQAFIQSHFKVRMRAIRACDPYWSHYIEFKVLSGQTTNSNWTEISSGFWNQNPIFEDSEDVVKSLCDFISPIVCVINLLLPFVNPSPLLSHMSLRLRIVWSEP